MKLLILLLLFGCAKAGDCILSANDDIVYKILSCNSNYCMIERVDNGRQTVVSASYAHNQLIVACNTKLR